VYFGQYTPIRRSEWLEVKEAWQVVRHWLETGGLSVAVEWRWE
jgi:hypothetical protein